MHKSLLLISLIIISITFSQAQNKTWTLEECINYGLDNNQEIKNYSLSYNIANAELQQTTFNYLPEISFGADAGKSFGRSVDPNTNSYINTQFFNNSYSVSASLNLFSGGYNYYNKKYRQQTTAAAQEELTRAKDLLAFRITNLYYDLVYNEKLLEIVKEQQSISEMNVKKTQSLVDVGLKSEVDLLEIKAVLESDNTRAIQTKNNVNLLKLSLQQEMNMNPADTSFNIVLLNLNNNASSYEPVAYNYLYNNIDNSPNIKIAQNRFQNGLNEIRISQSQYYPRIYFGANINTGFYETFKDQNNKVIDFQKQLENNVRGSIGVSLNVPIFNKNAVRNNVKKAKINYEIAKNNLEREKNNLHHEINKIYTEQITAYQEIEQTNRQQLADEKAFEAAQKKFDKGLINVIELQSSKVRLAETQASHARAKLTHDSKTKLMKYYQGERFWENK